MPSDKLLTRRGETRICLKIEQSNHIVNQGIDVLVLCGHIVSCTRISSGPLLWPRVSAATTLAYDRDHENNCFVDFRKLVSEADCSQGLSLASLAGHPPGDAA